MRLRAQSIQSVCMASTVWAMSGVGRMAGIFKSNLKGQYFRMLFIWLITHLFHRPCQRLRELVSLPVFCLLLLILHQSTRTTPGTIPRAIPESVFAVAPDALDHRAVFEEVVQSEGGYEAAVAYFDRFHKVLSSGVVIGVCPYSFLFCDTTSTCIIGFGPPSSGYRLSEVHRCWPLNSFLSSYLAAAPPAG